MIVNLIQREFQLVVREGHLRLISVGNMNEIMQVETRNFTEQELGLVLVRALNVGCVESDAGQIATALDGVAFAINGKLPQRQELPLDSCWALVDRFAEAVLKNEGEGLEPGEHYQAYLKVRDELVNAIEQ